jgi:multiple sugar transport system substrate-binding protein
MNTELFQQAGLDPVNKPPATVDDLIHVSETLSLKDNTGYKRFGFIPLYGNSDFYAYLYRYGGQLYDKNYKVTFNNEQGISAMDWLVKATDASGGAQMVNSYEQSFSSGANDPFIAGLVASKIDGCWYLSTLQQSAPNLGFALTPEPYPAGGHQATMIGGYNWSIAQQSKHVDQGFDFLAWFTMPAQAVAFAQATGNMPARKSVLNSDYIQKNPNIKFFYDALYYGVSYETGPWTQVLWGSANVTATQDALYHRKSPKDALDSAAQTVHTEINKWLPKK